jgi:cytochrome c-type biogenesis protein CcmE
MSQLDDELAQAVKDAEAEAVAQEPAPVVAPANTPPSASRKNLWLLGALLVMGGGILALVMTSFDDAAVYSRGVAQLLIDKEKLHGRSVKVQGALVKGSLKRRDQPCEYRFDLRQMDFKTMKEGPETVAVRYAQCVVPDTFRDMPGMDVEVTAQGTLDAAGHFEASQIVAKCPSKYEMNERAKKGEVAPHTGVDPSAAR